MMASCSSDDVVATAPGAGAGAGDNGLVPVELTVGGPTVSVQKRGIGTVGDIEGEAGNVWKGEALYLLMMQRSTATGTNWGYSQWAYMPESGTDVDDSVRVVNFGNVEVNAPATGQTGALTWPKETTPKYYPNSGTHDFFAYNIDDAKYIYTVAPVDEPVPDTDYFTAFDTTMTDTVAKYVWFKIDGTQDLMFGAATDGYSASTARVPVVPEIAMRHLLSRFTFQVASADASADGIEVTSIRVKSKTTGKMIVAYDLGQEKVAPNCNLWFELPTDDTMTPEPVQEEFLLLRDRTTDDGKTPMEEDAATVTLDDFVTADPLNWQNIGHALMVAPGASAYEMEISLKQTFLTDDNPDSTPDPVGTTTLTRNIEIPAGDVVAKAGSSYNVQIKVYGMAKIEVNATLNGWVDGGDISVDTNLSAGDTTDDDEEEVVVP